MVVENCCACSVCQSDSSDYFLKTLIAQAHADGTYVLGEGSVIAADGVDIPGDSSTTATISVGESVTDELEVVGDTDWFAITLTADQTVSISLNGTGASPVADTYLRLLDADGNLVAQNDDGGEGLNSLLRFTASETATYYIEVDSYANREVGEYTLAVAEAEPLSVYTIDQVATQLTQGYWGGTERSFNVGADGLITVDITTLDADEQTLAREALNLWSDVTGIAFSEVESGAEITFINTEEGAYASSSRFGTTITSSTVNVSSSWTDTYGTDLDGYSFQTYVHEIGHALGLGHGGNYNGGASFANDALYLNDSWATTVMSYFDQRENSYFSQLGFSYAAVTSPMIADVAAITNLYGSSTTTRVGDTVYGFNSTSDRSIHDATQFSNTAYTIVDSGGFDTLDYSQHTADQLIDLNEEAFMNIGGRTGNVTIGRGTVIEAALGGVGDDVINGNAAVNDLRGNTGNDTIEGASGSDVIYGGFGNDLLSGSAGWDKIWGEDGADEVSGGNGTDIIYGDAGADLIYGDNGDDFLFGGSDNDSLFGGNGADTLRGEGGLDEVFGGGGDDLIFGGDGVDNLQGGIDHDQIDGGNGSDLLFGQDGNDVLLGGPGWDTILGGDGDDTLSGGTGNDYLYGGYGLNTVTGGTGADIFYMDMFGPENVTTITDFDTAVDTIRLNRSIGFGTVGWGDLADSAFVEGTEALDANDRILYDATTGEIFYDPDGVGGVDAFLFAQVEAGTQLTADHFRAVGAPVPPPIGSQAAEPLLGADLVPV